MPFSYLTAILFALVGCNGNSGEPERDAIAATPDYVDQALRGRVSQHGLYKRVRSGGLVDNANTSTGKTVSSAVVQQVRSTDRIPLIKGANMYLQYRLWYFPDQPAYVDLRRVLKHPEMTLPDGTVSTGSDYMIKGRVSVNQVIAYTGYGFDEDYELLKGDWIFEIWHEDRKLVEQKFTAYWPDDEEIAALASVFAPDAAATADPESSGRNWPRVVVKEAETKESSDPQNE